MNLREKVYETRLQNVKRSLPVLRVHGPMEPPPERADLAEHWNSAEDHFFEKIIDVMEEARKDSAVVQEIVTRV